MGAALVAMAAGGAAPAERAGQGGRAAPDERDADKIRAGAGELRERLLRLVDEDAAAYTAVIEALRLPRGSDEEKRRRRRARDRAYVTAAEAPLAAAEACVEVLAAAASLAARIRPQYASDLAAGALLAHAGAAGALLNFDVNLPHLKDETAAARLRQRAAALSERAETLRDEVWRALAGPLRR
jgi:formiminotetrahydrofolate cyclodeaminase